MNILVVEDDPTISSGIIAFLTAANHTCTLATDGITALELFHSKTFDFILLDIMLPKKSGLEVLKAIRSGKNPSKISENLLRAGSSSDIPVLVLTALSDDETQISAFNSLADGFINKPFSLPVLAARIDAIHKRRHPITDSWQFENCSIDFRNYQATLNHQPVKLNPKELDVLKTLLTHKNQVLTRTQIIDQTWDYDEDIPLERVVDAYVKSLRKKLGLHCIVTVKNVGYKLELP